MALLYNILMQSQPIIVIADGNQDTSSQLAWPISFPFVFIVSTLLALGIFVAVHYAIKKYSKTTQGKTFLNTYKIVSQNYYYFIIHSHHEIKKGEFLSIQSSTP